MRKAVDMASHIHIHNAWERNLEFLKSERGIDLHNRLQAIGHLNDERSCRSP